MQSWDEESERLTFAKFIAVFLIKFLSVFRYIQRSRAGFLNYSKRKDIESTGEADESNIHSGRGTGCGVRARSEVGVGSGEVVVGSGELGVGSWEW